MTSKKPKKAKERIVLIDDDEPTINYRVNPSTQILKILKHVLANKELSDDGSGVQLAILDSKREQIEHFSPTDKISDLVKTTEYLPLRIGILDTSTNKPISSYDHELSQ